MVSNNHACEALLHPVFSLHERHIAAIAFVE
jgi:hypothetical protein